MGICFFAVKRIWKTSEVSPERSWSLSVNMNQSKIGWEAVITSCIRLWWRSSSLMYCGLFPVSNYMNTLTVSCSWISVADILWAERMSIIYDKCDPAGTLTQAIRNFAKSLESWLTSAMSDFPQEIVRTKVQCVCILETICLKK